MLQRIQSVYLALVICCCIVLCFFNVFTFQARDGVYELSVVKTSFISQAKVSVVSYNFPLLIINILIVILSLATVFRYNNRQLQIRLITIILLLILSFIGVLFFDYRQLVRLSGSATTASLPWVLIIVPIEIILLFLARMGIKKDEKLVRSADRLR